MIWTKEQLQEVIDRHDTADIFVGVLWSKKDVEYELAEFIAPSEGISDEARDNFDIDQFWEEYSNVIDDDLDNHISYTNLEMSYQILRQLKGEVPAE